MVMPKGSWASDLSHVVAIASDGRPLPGTRLGRPMRVRLGRPGGKRIVLLDAETYERMMERIDDVEAGAAYAGSRGEESFPAEVVRRLVKRENPVRVFREHRGLTMQALATAIGRSKAYLSEIERGKKPGSVKVLSAIARVLGVDVDDLLPPRLRRSS